MKDCWKFLILCKHLLSPLLICSALLLPFNLFLFTTHSHAYSSNTRTVNDVLASKGTINEFLIGSVNTQLLLSWLDWQIFLFIFLASFAFCFLFLVWFFYVTAFAWYFNGKVWMIGRFGLCQWHESNYDDVHAHRGVRDLKTTLNN